MIQTLEKLLFQQKMLLDTVVDSIKNSLKKDDDKDNKEE